MIRADGCVGLFLAGQLWPWSIRGYGAPSQASLPGQVEVLTPPSIMAAITAGYRPLVHPTALTRSSPLAGQMPPGVRVHPSAAAAGPQGRPQLPASCPDTRGSAPR
jgi:hypothetical protein